MFKGLKARRLKVRKEGRWEIVRRNKHNNNPLPMKNPVTLLSYPLAGLIVLLSRLPWRVLYAIASFLAFMMADVIAYRRKVVLNNLRNAFPDKGEKEIRKIARSFYHHLTDVLVETIKLLRISDKEMMRRCRIGDEGKALLREHYNKGHSLIGLLGHFGNWEWVPPVTSLNFPFAVIPAYRPLKDKVFDRLMLKIRGRYAHELVPKKQVGRAMIRYKRGGSPFIMGLIADQTPHPQTAYWTKFLSQDTPVYSGPEKLARSMGMPVFFVALRRQRRGHYLLHVVLMTENAAEMKEGALSQQFMGLLEQEIHRSPADWLWSHRRWKHRRQDGGQ